MKFSIIIPAYNCEKTIDRCISSILNQKYDDIEILVINDGSCDNTELIIRKNYPSINLFTTKNSGVSKARNLGLQNATGDYVIFLDSDDELCLNALDLYKKEIEISGSDIIFSSFLKIYKNKKKSCVLFDRKKINIKDEKDEFNVYYHRLVGTVWGKCYKRELLQNCEFNTKLSYCEDAEFNYRVFSKAKKCSYIPDVTYNYYYLDTSAIHSFNIEKTNKYLLSINMIYNNCLNKSYESDAIVFCLIVFNVIAFNVILNKKNKAKYKDKKNALKKLRSDNLTITILKHLQYNQLPFIHSICLFLFRHKLYYFMYLISMI